MSRPFFNSASFCSEWFLDPEVFNLKPTDSVAGNLPADSILASSDVADVSDLNTKLHSLYCENITVEVAHMVVS